MCTDSQADASAPGSSESHDYNPTKPGIIIVAKTKEAREAYQPKPKGKQAFAAHDEDLFIDCRRHQDDLGCQPFSLFES